MNPSPPKRYWFHAKRYGYGWGLPATWEGWVVLVAFLAGAIGGVAIFPPEPTPLPYIAFLAVISVLLTLICYLTGEPPKWRWGNASEDEARRRAAAVIVPNPSRVIMLLTHLLLGPVILGVAIFFRVYPPAEINHSYGYRTATSMRSQEAWDEAQRYSANAMIIAGAVVVVYQVLSALTMKPALSLGTSVAVLLLAIFAVVPITEAHLKNTFDGQGRRMVLPAPNP
jgi:uncharacterized membrane protein